MNKKFNADEVLIVFSLLASLDPKNFDIEDDEDPEASEAYAVWHKLRSMYNQDGRFYADLSTEVEFELD